jgi:lipoate-protein ligase A
MHHCRLIVDAPADGGWNMAIDDALLTDAAEQAIATLRFYGWKVPTLSLGYFQTFQSRDEHRPSRGCEIVRRASGGGAILHHHELTYSLAMPAAYWPERAHGRLYCVVHDSLCNALASLGVTGSRRFGADACNSQPQRDEARDEAPSNGEPFLCFERRTEHDVVLAAAKIAGSAQRKRRGAVLQHGSVLLAQSQFAPTLLGVQELAHVSVSPEQLIAAWQPLLADALSLRFNREQLSAATATEARRALEEKFAAEAWLKRR